MRITTACAAILITLTAGVGSGLAQTRYDVGLLLGTTRTSDEDRVLEFDKATTYQATFAWRIWEDQKTALSIEVPFLASPAFAVATPGSSLPKEYAALYLTPGVRVTVWPNGAVSVFGSAGAGYARYSESKERADGSPNPSQRDTNTRALQIGGGVDIRALRWLGVRGEVRKVHTGPRNFSIATPREDVHNVIISGGLVLRF